MKVVLFSTLRSPLKALILLVLLAALALILHTTSEQRRLAAFNARENMLQLVRRAVAEHEQLIEGTRRLLIGLAHLPQVKEHQAEACNKLFRELVAQFPTYTHLLAAKPDGDVFCSSTPIFRPVNIADRPNFKRTLETRSFTVSDYLIERISGKPATSLSYPSLDHTGNIKSYVAVGMDLTWFNKFAAQAPLPSGATISIIDRQGTVLAHYPNLGRDWIGHSVKGTPLVQGMLTQGEGVVETPDLDGITRLQVFTPLQSTEEPSFFVSVGIPRSSAFAEATEMLTHNLAWLAAIGWLALTGAWFLSELFFLRRLKTLLRVTKQLAAGNLSARSRLPHEKGEINQLVQAIDEMAESLERSTAERKRAEVTINQLNHDLTRRTEQLEATNQDLEAFSHSVSHDLRAPLRAIGGFSKILLDDFSTVLSAEVQRMLRIICTNTQQMGKLIDDLLTFSRLSRKSLERTTIDMAALAHSVVEELTNEVRASHPTITIKPLVSAVGNSLMMRQVWANLVSNALKFSGARSQPQVEIGCYRNGKEATYYVKDNGVGFDMAYADKLFGVFQRLHSVEEFEGTGVGLAIVKRIVNRHDGRVWADAEANQGATFYFTLPTESEAA